MTLMSADIDRIGLSMEDVHELYAGPLELGLALWLLYRFLGVAMSASTAFVVGKLSSTSGDAKEYMTLTQNSLSRRKLASCNHRG